MTATDHVEGEAASPGTIVRVTLLLASCMTVMAGATISPSLPALYDHFSGTPGVDFLARLVLTLPALFIAVCSPLAGFIVDRLGRKPVIIVGAILYVLGGTTGLYVESLTAVLVGRAVLGVAVACVMTTTVTLIGDYWEGEARGRMMGWMSAFMSWGGVVFVLLGGALAELHWRGPFGVYLVALGLLPFLVLALREPVRHSGAPDGAGTGGPPSSDHPAETNWPLIAVVYLAAFLLNITFYMVPTQAPFLLRDLGIVAPFAAGVAIAAMNVAGGIGSLQYGRVRRRLSEPAAFGVSFSLVALGFLGVSQAQGQVTFMLAMLVSGLGVGSAFPNITSWLMSLAPPHLRGRLVGGTTMSIFFGQFASPALSQPLVAAVGKPGAFAVVAGLLALISAGFWTLAARVSR
ncbi:MFS transporter [Rhodospira trueperi]|uniref:Predicted arabinose efflux permease, MFS family n=1 Tax=Rhodospira trueperi TaxID=69960 RepID=A0A1G6XEW7_9PROT|nr:MFS transporter [Rhodospira trueperi]SDD75855.1 Predicted arabinose efflux permease, MFS family [Rhodospira trueperi]